MTTSYPAGLDSYTNPTATDELDDEIGTRTHSEFHADNNDAIEAIQAELGTDPSGSEATVKARIAAAETATANHLADVADAHAASAITNTAAGNLVATTVQAALNELDTEKLATTTAATTYQPLDTDLTAIAALTSAADKVPYSTGAGTWALTDFSAFGRTLVDDADASTARSTLGLVIGTNVQAQDAELSAIAGLTSAADALPYFTGAGTAAVTTLTAAARTVLDDATVGAMLATMGGATAASPTFTGVASFAAGSAAAPALTFTGDTNTGIYSDAADTVKVTTGGTLRATFGSNNLHLQAGSVTDIPLQVQGTTAQSGALQRWMNVAGTTLASINAAGDFSFSNAYAGYLHDTSGTGPYVELGATSVKVINRTTTSNVPLTVKGMAAQSGALQLWQDSTTATLASVSATGLGAFAGVTVDGSTGRLRFGHADQAQTTVGAAGGASALPATPTKYFKVKDSGGTEYVIPAYAAA